MVIDSTPGSRVEPQWDGTIGTAPGSGRLFDTLKLWAWQLAPSLVTPLSGPPGQDSGKRGRAPSLSGPSVPGESEVIDAYPSAAFAIRAAEASRPDVVFGPYGSGRRWRLRPPAKGSSGTTGSPPPAGAAGVPGVVDVESPAYRYLAAVLETLAAEGLGEGSEVVIVRVDAGFGREVAEGAAVAARRLGLLRRSVTFRPGGARDVLAQVPAGDVLLSAGSFDDDVAIAQWASERRWRAVGLVAAGVDGSGTPSVIALRGFADRASGSTTGQMIPRKDPTASGSATVTGTRTVLSRPIRLLRPSPRVSFGSAA